MRWRPLAAALLSVFPASLWAQEPIETIVILSPGAAHQTQSIDNRDLIETAPGTSPLKGLGLLPGVTYTGSDSFGAYEYASRISVRGFNGFQLGYTLDGVPLGDMHYSNWNGLHISRAAISETISKAEITQYSGDLGTPSNSNLGGTLRFTSLPPSDDPHVLVEQAYGSDDTRRSYARIDSGLLDSGTKLALSAADNQTDTWKGHLPQKQYQLNFKGAQVLGDSTSLGFFINYSDRRENDYQDLSLYYLRTVGYGLQNYTDWSEAVQAAHGNYPSWLKGVTDPADAAYAGSYGMRRDWLGGATLDAHPWESVELKTVLYGHIDHGQGGYALPARAPYTDPTGSALFERSTDYRQIRAGLTEDVAWEIGASRLSSGLWLGNNRFHDFRGAYSVQDLVPPDLLAFRTDPYFIFFDNFFHETVVQGYVSESYRLTDDLILTAGFEGTRSDLMNRVISDATTPYAQGHLIAASPFLPQLGATWNLSADHELFLHAAETLRAFTADAFDTPFQVVQKTFNQLHLQPETAWTGEIGYRLTRGPLALAAALYRADFHNRLVTSNPCPLAQQGIVPGCVTAFHNVGSVHTTGAELAANWRILPSLSWYGAASYNRSIYGDDYSSNGALVTTKGKTTVDSPDLTLKSRVTYREAPLYGTVTTTYTSKRYLSYLNDSSVPAFALVDLAIGIELEPSASVQSLRLQLSVSNLFQERYISTLGTGGFVVSGDAQTLQAGAPRSWFVTLAAGF